MNHLKYEGLSWGEKKLLTSIVSDLSDHFMFSKSKAIDYLLTMGKKEKKKKKKITKVETTELPFCNHVYPDRCKSIVYNYSLYTQCKKKIEDGEFCRKHAAQADKSPSGKPTYGNIKERMEEGREWKQKKGTKLVPFYQVAEKKGWCLESAEHYAESQGLTISNYDLGK